MEASAALSRLARRFRREAGPSRVHRWGIATAVTADGATVEVELELVIALTPADADPAVPRDELEIRVCDAVEDEIRRAITSSRLAELPGAGDNADWVEGVLVAGARVEHAVVSRADVQVTAELRRLVAGDRAGPG